MFDIFLCIWYTIFMKKDMFTINKNGLSYGRGYVYSLQYHLVWCTKYRKKVLKDGIDVECKEMLESLAQEYKFQILAMEVMPDHIHLLVDCRPQFYISDMIKIIANLRRFVMPFLCIQSFSHELWGGHRGILNRQGCNGQVTGAEQVLCLEGQKENLKENPEEKANENHGSSYGVELRENRNIHPPDRPDYRSAVRYLVEVYESV